MQNDNEKKNLCALCCADVKGGAQSLPLFETQQHQEPGKTPAEIPTPSPPEVPPNTEHAPVKEPPQPPQYPNPRKTPTKVPPMRYSALPHSGILPNLPDKSCFWFRDLEQAMKTMFN